MVEELLAEHDWFDLAQQTRSKKFGEELPTERKEQARHYVFYNIVVLVANNAGRR